VTPPVLSGGLMVCGTTSDAGKSTVVAGLCRLLARRGVKVAPFKAQNMALNSAVTPDGHEIGRAQAAQAHAAGVVPEVAMNPVLLKPTSDRDSQVVVMGRPWARLDAAGYQEAKAQLWPIVRGQLEELRSRFDAVICEGAGSPAEINLFDTDIVNLRVARSAGFPAIVVGDIDRGGVFAALYGTVALLPAEWRELVQGFVINKFRGDPAILGDGPDELQRRTGVPCLGVLPWLGDLGLDAEDSLALRRGLGRPAGSRSAGSDPSLDVAVVAFPRISNFTDLDPLTIEPGVRVRLVESEAALGCPDLVVLPGTKATVADLEWLRRAGLAGAIEGLADGPAGTPILGICGGYQMLGRTVMDPGSVETATPSTVPGLGLLPVSTEFHPVKITRRVQARALGHRVDGYEIRHGRTPPVAPWLQTESGPEGSSARDAAVLGTSLHGLFDSDGFRAAFLAAVAARKGKVWAPSAQCFAAARDRQADALADALERHLDIGAIEELIWPATGQKEEAQ
jgi:adenosylcobyric acid synthase